MKQLGLIGYPLSHSFSKRYFTEKFDNAGLSDDWHYELFPIETIEKLPEILRGYPNLVGLNVTIPYKESALPFMHELDKTAATIGAVNCIKITYPDGQPHLKGYNTDYYGFQKSLLGLLKGTENPIKNNSPVCYAESFETVETTPLQALILGTGGAAKAVAYALTDLNIPYFYVSRKGINNGLSYGDLNKDILTTHQLVINTTPLGMSPNVDSYPQIPYEYVDNRHFFYDLVYNPEITTFMKYGIERGAKAKSGLDMLYFQAEKGWEIWNS